MPLHPIDQGFIASNRAGSTHSIGSGYAYELAAAAGGGNDANTVLLLHCDGTDGSTTFIDDAAGGNAPHTMTANSNAQIDTAQAQFGTASMLVAGTGDFVSALDDTDWDMGSGDFTADLWVRWASSPSGNRVLIGQWNAATSERGWLIFHDGTNLQFLYSTTGANAAAPVVAAWAPSTDTWYHVAAVRSGSSWFLFVDGTQIGSTGTASVTIFDSSAVLGIGANGAGGQEFDGWFDEVRVSNVARWTADFTPSTAAYS